MKNKYMRLIPFTLSAAILLAAGIMQPTEITAAENNTVSETSSAQASSDDVTESADYDASVGYDASEAVSITLSGSTAQASSDAVSVNGSTVTITAAGTYILTGTLDDGCIIVDAGKEDKVQLVLDGASIHSETFAALYVLQADKVTRNAL